MIDRRIHSMGAGQTELVRAAVVPAARDWARTHSYVVGSITLGVAMADMNRDCYIGIANVVLFHRGSLRYDGTLTWDADHTFAVAAAPTVELAEAGAWTSPELERVDAQLRLQPADADLLQTRGYRLRDLGRCEEALSAFDASLMRNPSQPGVQYWRGRTLSQLDRKDDALVAFESALREEPGNAAALQALGITLHSLYRYAESLAAHDASIEADPSDANAHCLRGWTLEDLRRTEDAIESYETALRIAPAHPIALRRRALALYRTGRTEDAIAALEAAIAVLPDDQELGRALDDALKAKQDEQKETR
jgi:tetratricopeptide (TPR) repeat protein